MCLKAEKDLSLVADGEKKSEQLRDLGEKHLIQRQFFLSRQQ